MATITNHFATRWGIRLGAILAVCLGSIGCGYYHYSTPLRPIDDQGTAMTIADDGSGGIGEAEDGERHAADERVEGEREQRQ